MLQTQKAKNTKVMVQTALIASLYAVITLAVAPIAYSTVQFRVSEVLTVLPAYTSLAIPGLTLGCVIANIIGWVSGINPIGWIDAIVGSIATLMATYLSYKMRKIPNKTLKFILVPIPPVIINAILVGLELTFVFNGGVFVLSVFIANFISVFIGQAVICYVLGVPLMIALENKSLAVKIFGEV